MKKSVWLGTLPLMLAFLQSSAQDELPERGSRSQRAHHQSRRFHAWKHPRVKLSPPPPLMGKQMGVVETPGIPPLGYELDGKVKVFRLIAQPVEQVLTDGKSMHKQMLPQMKKFMGLMHTTEEVKKLRGWGYNGHTPGPTIEVNEGDTVRIIFKNELPEPTTVHWHGIELPFAQDGSTEAVKPGETKVYEFTLFQSGTYMYHSGFNVSKQETYGLGGFFIVHPKSYERTVDRDIAIMLQEWSLLPGNSYPNVMSMDFNWFTFNGHAAPSIPPLEIKQGQRVRIRLGNISMDSHPIHIHGHRWEVVGTEGGPLQKSAYWTSSTVNVPPGTTRDVELVAWNPGPWPFHCHKVHHVMNAHAQVPMGIMGHGGMFTIFDVIPADPSKPWKHPGQVKPADRSLDAFGFKKEPASPASEPC